MQLQNLLRIPSSVFQSAKQNFALFNELAIKEGHWIFYTAWQYIHYYFSPHAYGLDKEIQPAEGRDNVNVVFLIPGQGANPSLYLPLAKKTSFQRKIWKKKFNLLERCVCKKDIDI